MTEPGHDRSPLYEAHNAQRYERQTLIRAYQDAYSCRLVVLLGFLFPNSVTLFEDTLYDATPQEDLHIMLQTPGGDGETALRLLRQAQSRCKRLTVMIPDQAKSAGTLFVLGADEIYMGPTSDLGPIDPQFRMSDNSVVPARAIIAAVRDAEERVQKSPDTYALHASLLSNITSMQVQQAKDAIARTGDQLKEALACAGGRDEGQLEKLASDLQEPLVESPQSHGTTISAADAKKLGLPVRIADPLEPQWQDAWRMWAKYAAAGAGYGGMSVYEGQKASHLIPA